jgi:hypothetical protein
MELPIGSVLPESFKKLDLPGLWQSGDGTLENPKIYWVAPVVYPDNGASPLEFENPRTQAVTRIARELAVEAKCTYVWIRRGNHNMRYTYNPDGTRVVRYNPNGCPIGFFTVEADPHITLSLGLDDQSLVLHGHINVTEDDDAVPIGRMEQGTRKHIFGGDDRVLELFEWEDRTCFKYPRPVGSSSYCHAHVITGLDQHICNLQNWKTRNLADHYCPCPHEIDCEHYCPCPHDEIRRTAHTCVCPHENAADMHDHWCPCIHEQMRYIRVQ